MSRFISMASEYLNPGWCAAGPATTPHRLGPTFAGWSLSSVWQARHFLAMFSPLVGLADARRTAIGVSGPLSPPFFIPSAIVPTPARMGAPRLPGKPLADIAGAPMIVHVLRRALAADVGPVFVATEDKVIVDAVAAAGGRAIMTGAHDNGT